MPGIPYYDMGSATASTCASFAATRGTNAIDQRMYQDVLLHALGEWWDEVGFATRPEDASYAPKYQVVCKETVQKLLYSWLQRREVRGVYPVVSSLSYEEFASKLGEPALWQKWWNAKVAPASGIAWGPRGQWCRLYRLHNALPPFVRLRTLSTEDAAGVRPTSDRSPWLVDQLKVLRALEDYWEDVGIVLASGGRTDDGSFIGGDIDESFLRGGAEVERGGAVLALDISAIEPNMDQSAIHDVSVDDINGLDTSELIVEYWSEQLTNHRDLVQGLHEWIHSDPSRQRMYKSAASIDKYTFRAHLNQVWSFWWASKIEPKCGVAWGSCGRFNRRLRLPPYVRMKEHVNDASPVDFSEIQEPSHLGNLSFSAVNTSSTFDTHRGMVRGALLDACRDWWSGAGVVIRPEEVSEAMKREQVSEFNVSKLKIQLLLYSWLRSPAAQAAHPVAAAVKFRALSSMLGYLWGRWWDSCVAPLAGIRWGGSGRFSNKGVLPPFVRLRETFANIDKEMRASVCDIDVDADSDGEEVEPTLMEDDSFLVGYKAILQDLSASDLYINNSASWASASYFREKPISTTRASMLRREAGSAPLSPLSSDCVSAAQFFANCDDRDDEPLSSPTSVLDISHDSRFLHPGLLEVLDGIDGDQGQDVFGDDPTFETPTTTSTAAFDSFNAPHPASTTRSRRVESHLASGVDCSWESLAWGTSGPSLTNIRTGHPFTTDPIHTIPIDAPAVSSPMPSSSSSGGGRSGYQLWDPTPTKASAATADKMFDFRSTKSAAPPGSSTVGSPSRKAPGSPTMFALQQQQIPLGTAVPVSFFHQKAGVTAVLQQQAAMLADLITARSSMCGTAEELAQLNMAQQILYGFVSSGIPPPSMTGMHASNAGLSLAQMGFPMGNTAVAGPPRPQCVSASLMAAVGLPDFPSTLL